jgi:hypothetical protein
MAVMTGISLTRIRMAATAAAAIPQHRVRILGVAGKHFDTDRTFDPAQLPQGGVFPLVGQGQLAAGVDDPTDDHGQAIQRLRGTRPPTLPSGGVDPCAGSWTCGVFLSTLLVRVSNWRIQYCPQPASDALSLFMQ